MNSGKTALALMCKFNYEQQGFNVMLMKSSFDTRDIENNEIIIKSRIGLKSKCYLFSKLDSINAIFNKVNTEKKIDVIIIDECQFLTSKQVDELHIISTKIPVLCYGLLTDFQTLLFEGSKRLVEVAESIQELKSVCTCGRKATVNARFVDGRFVTTGESLALESGTTTYQSLCFTCYNALLNK